MPLPVVSTPRVAPDFVLPDHLDRPYHLYQRLSQSMATVLVFIRGHWCPYCRRYLGKLRDNQSRFAEFDTQVVIVSPEPSATSRSLVESMALPYPVLSDVEGVVIDQYGTRNSFTAAARRSLIPHPGVFILDQRAQIRFRSVDRNYKKRTTMHTIFDHLQHVR